jgi:cytidylate kinase
VAPLRRAEDAVLLDTTGMGFEEQVGEIVRLVRARLPRFGEPDSL